MRTTRMRERFFKMTLSSWRCIKSTKTIFNCRTNEKGGLKLRPPRFSSSSHELYTMNKPRKMRKRVWLLARLSGRVSMADSTRPSSWNGSVPTTMLESAKSTALWPLTSKLDERKVLLRQVSSMQFKSWKIRRCCKPSTRRPTDLLQIYLSTHN